MNGHQAFDRLQNMGVMCVNGLGKGTIIKAPKDHRDFDEFVTLIKTLGAYSVGESPHKIGVERARNPEGIIFMKR